MNQHNVATMQVNMRRINQKLLAPFTNDKRLLNTVPEVCYCAQVHKFYSKRKIIECTQSFIHF